MRRTRRQMSVYTPQTLKLPNYSWTGTCLSSQWVKEREKEKEEEEEDEEEKIMVVLVVVVS